MAPCERKKLMRCSESCTNGIRCKHEHGEFLVGEERLVQQHKSRGNPCNSSHSCRRADCLNGHHCKNMYGGRTCLLGESCKFAKTHDMDVVSCRLLVFVNLTIA